MANFILVELKKIALKNKNPHVQPNPRRDSLTWVEFMNFKQVGKMQKVEVQTELALLHTQQRQDEYMAIAYAKSHASDEDQKDDE